jgi:hypothetical protein
MYTYSLNVERKNYTLPAKSLRVVEDMDRVSQIDNEQGMSIRDKFDTILKFIIDLVGEDNAKEMLGSTDIEEVDLSVVTITFRKIVDAYNKPIADYNARRSGELFSSIPSDKIEKITKLAEVAREVTND